MRLAAGAITGAIAVACLFAPRDARACAAFSESGPVAIHREDALIVWDGARHEEHFIRTAVFDTSAKSFGFLVPTPAQPSFAEVGDGWIEALKSATAPAVVEETRFVAQPVGCTMLPLALAPRKGTASALAGAAFDDGVRVLAESQVAGLDVAVLDASDAGALARWLAAHDFPFRDALKRWVEPYLAKKWKISAFRYARPDLASNAPMAPPSVASRAVRITFAADQPVYPYREPDDAPSVDYRELHLFVLGAERLDGAETDRDHAVWKAQLPFAAPVAPPSALAAALGGVTLPPTVWVNEFVDATPRRDATDLVFERAAQAAEVHPPPHVIVHERRIYVPYEVPFVALGVAWYWRRRRRAKRSAKSDDRTA